MSDPTSEAPAEGGIRAEVSDEIGRSLSSIWQRRDGARPAAITTEYRGDVVRCEIEQGVAPEPAEGEESKAAAVVGSTDSAAYRNEALAAVARLTKRSVSGFVAKRDPKSGLTTHTFILERIRVKY